MRSNAITGSFIAGALRLSRLPLRPRGPGPVCVHYRGQISRKTHALQRKHRKRKEKSILATQEALLFHLYLKFCVISCQYESFRHHLFVRCRVLVHIHSVSTSLFATEFCVVVKCISRWLCFAGNAGVVRFTCPDFPWSPAGWTLAANGFLVSFL